jgi:hypothetical protein
VVDEAIQILGAALTKARKRDLHHPQAVVEILTKAPGGDGLL